jgi:hypothetical protein
VSLNTFVFSIFAIIFSYNNDIITIFQAMTIASYASMQLLEYFIWKDILHNKYNELLSRIGSVILILQPIFSLLTIENIRVKYVSLILYGFYMVSLIIGPPNAASNFSTVVGKNKHLQWNWMESIEVYKYVIYLCALIIPTFFWKQDKYHVIFALLILTLVMSYTLFSKDNTWGSMWCWTAISISIYLIFLVFFKEVCL